MPYEPQFWQPNDLITAAKMNHIEYGISNLTENITTEVSSWLDDHPEATTTIVDGAITWDKLSSALQEQIGNLLPSTDDDINYILGL